MRKYIKASRTPEELANLLAIREWFDRERPTIEDLEAMGHTFAPLGEVLQAKAARRAQKEKG